MDLHIPSDIILCLEFIILFNLLFGKQITQLNGKRKYIFAMCILFWIVCSFMGIWLQDIYIGPCSIFILLIYIVEWCIFDLNLAEILSMGVAQWFYISVLENIVISPLMQFGWMKSREENFSRLIISVVLLCIYFINKKKNIHIGIDLSPKIWFVIDAIMAVLTSMIMYYSYVLGKYQIDESDLHFGEFIMAISKVIILLLVFEIIYLGNNAHDLFVQNRIADMKNETQREYFQKMLERETDTKKFRHDITNDLLQLQSYCLNNKYDKVEKYLAKILGETQKISKDYYDVGNDVINTFLNYYISPLNKEYKVVVSGYVSDDLCIDERDLCVLISNILKNAAEAIQETDDGYIRVVIRDGQDYFNIEVINSFIGDIVRNKKGKIISTKKEDNHGIGISNMENITKKYDGMFEIEIKEKEFKASAYLKKNR